MYEYGYRGYGNKEMNHCSSCDWVTKIDKTDTSLELLRRAKELREI